MLFSWEEKQNFISWRITWFRIWTTFYLDKKNYLPEMLQAENVAVCQVTKLFVFLTRKFNSAKFHFPKLAEALNLFQGRAFKKLPGSYPFPTFSNIFLEVHPAESFCSLSSIQSFFYFSFGRVTYFTNNLVPLLAYAAIYQSSEAIKHLICLS